MLTWLLLRGEIMIPWNIIRLGVFSVFSKFSDSGMYAFLIWSRKMLLKIQSQRPFHSYHLTSLSMPELLGGNAVSECVFQGIRSYTSKYKTSAPKNDMILSPQDLQAGREGSTALFTRRCWELGCLWRWRLLSHSKSRTCGAKGKGRCHTCQGEKELYTPGVTHHCCWCQFQRINKWLPLVPSWGHAQLSLELMVAPSWTTRPMSVCSPSGGSAD